MRNINKMNTSDKLDKLKMTIGCTDVVTTDGEFIKMHNVSQEVLAQNILNAIEDSNKQDEISEKKKKFIEKRLEDDELKKYIKENLGGFYFNYYKRFSDKLEPQYYVRFLYLCSYLSYNNILVIKNGNRDVAISEDQLQNILNLSKRETIYTKNSLVEHELITVDKYGCIVINKKYCKKGDIMKGKQSEVTRVFDNAISELYNKSSSKEHKKLALLFDLLPYVNLKYNMVCKNPSEELIERIEPYTIKELSTLLNQTNITRFKRSLLDLTVDNESVIVIHTIKGKSVLAVNPKIYYKGTDIDSLYYLQRLFDIIK